MKLIATICVAFATLTTPAFAADYAAENSAGGHVVLTDQPCPVDVPEAKDFRSAFTYDSKGDVAFGCWALAGGSVIVAWFDDGTVQKYDPTAFRKVDAGMQPAPRAKGERDA